MMSDEQIIQILDPILLDLNKELLAPLTDSILKIERTPKGYEVPTDIQLSIGITESQPGEDAFQLKSPETRSQFVYQNLQPSMILFRVFLDRTDLQYISRNTALAKPILTKLINQLLEELKNRRPLDQTLVGTTYATLKRPGLGGVLYFNEHEDSFELRMYSDVIQYQ